MIDRYGIIKRTKNLPLFHPYYLNYGGNKEEFYLILNTMGCCRWDDLMNRLSVFLNVCRFCYWSPTSTVYVSIVCFIDRSDYRTTWKRSRNYRPIVQMQHYMNRIMNIYCSEYSCNHFHRIWVKLKLFQNSWRIFVCYNKMRWVALNYLL